MSKSKGHTPGPWSVGMKPGPLVYGPRGELVTPTIPSMLAAGENIANARLIAAAPELLEAAEAALLRLESMGLDLLGADEDAMLNRETRAILRAAIQKARGE